MQSSIFTVESRFEDRKPPLTMAIDFSNVEFHSEADDADEHDALVFLSEQANQNITDLLRVIELKDHHV